MPSSLFANASRRPRTSWNTSGSDLFSIDRSNTRAVRITCNVKLLSEPGSEGLPAYSGASRYSSGDERIFARRARASAESSTVFFTCRFASGTSSIATCSDCPS